MIRVAPLTPGLAPDFEALMGPNGASAGCWCMLWRLRARDWTAGKGAGNRDAMRARIAAGPPPGLIAFAGAGPVGWVSVAPRAEFPRLAGSRVLAPVDEVPVWSVTCFFVKAGWRARGVATALLAGAVDFARAAGAGVLEGYPVDPGGARYANGFAWTGLLRLFAAAGFREVARRSPARPIMRLDLREGGE